MVAADRNHNLDLDNVARTPIRLACTRDHTAGRVHLVVATVDRGGNRAQSVQLVPFPDGCSNRHFRKEALVPAGSSTLGPVAVVVDIASHAFRRLIRNNCYSVGEGSFHRQDIGEHHAVDLPAYAPLSSTR